MSFRRSIRNFFARAIGYESAAGGRRWRNASELVSPPAAALAGRAVIMRRARGAYANQSFARAIIDAWTASAIGTGIKPVSKSPANADEINASFAAWWDRCDADELTGFDGIQSALFRSMALTGDGVAIMQVDARGELRLKLVSSEQVATVSNDLAGGRYILDGVEFDAGLRRAALHLFRNPPGLPLPSPSLETLRVPIEDVIHLFRADHVGMVRGVSWLAPVLSRLTDLDGTSDALVMRARVAAQFCGFVTEQDGSILGEEDARGETPMEPGAMIRLRPGEGVEFAQPPQLGEETPAFLKSIVREIASGAGVPFELISGDLSDANYSSLRGSMMAFRTRVEQIQYAVVVPALRKIYRRWLTLEILSGRISAPQFEVAPEAFLACDWLAPKAAPVDPLKDTEAALLQMRAGLRSRRELVAELGRDLEALDAEIARDKASAAALGLDFSAPAPQQQPEPAA